MNAKEKATRLVKLADVNAMFASVVGDVPQWMRADFDRVLNAVVEEIEARGVDMYEVLFTEGELDEMLAWYGSPTGQKVTKLAPMVTEQLQAVGAAAFNKHAAALDAISRGGRKAAH